MGNLSTPKSVQKLQMALHAKAKAEAGYRFYALYDKISREDILAHAYAQSRSNKGAPGVDGQEFTDIEAYGAQRWLGELALALRPENYRPDPIRRVFMTCGQGQTQAACHLDRAGSGLYDGSNAGAGTDLRSRPSTRAVRVPPWAKCRTGGHRSGRAAVPEEPPRATSALAAGSDIGPLTSVIGGQASPKDARLEPDPKPRLHSCVVRR